MAKRILTYLLILAGLAFAACAPASRQQVLTFFFDGVPAPEKDSTGEYDTSTIAHQVTENDSVMKTTISEYYVHEPYRKKQCGACHDANNVGKLIKEESALCYICHQDFNTLFSSLHGPVDAGFCSTCHLPHLSKNKGLLLQPGNELCLPCHVKEEVKRPRAHVDIQEKLCVECHDPHGMSAPHRLKKPIPLER